MKRTTTLTTLAVASALALAGCGSAGEDSTGAAPETSTATAAGTATADATSAAPSVVGAGISAEHNDQDVMFAQDMRVHHEQAVEMSGTLLAKESIPEDVRGLAEGVIAAQGPEIEQMDRMLRAWEASATAESGGMEGMDHGSMDGGSDGMISEEELDRLESAQGTEAARLYLEQMTVHHEGAIDMAREEAANGANPEAIELAEDVVAAQEAEIAEMDRMLQALPDGS